MPDYKTIGNFRVDRDKDLGCGTFGEVFEAEHVITKEKAAAKKIYLGTDSDWIARVQREVDALMKIPKHKNIIKYLGHEREGRSLWIFTEFCQFGDLEKYCIDNVISDQDKVSIMIEICEAVRHLHQQRTPVVHRDIKGGNILISKSHSHLVPKLCDFGFAKEVDRIAGKTKNFSTYCGTEGYLPPEMYEIITKGEVSYEKSVDIFSLAILFLDFFEAQKRQLNPIQSKLQNSTIQQLRLYVLLNDINI